MCPVCHSEKLSPVALKQGHNLCWVCNGLRATVAKDAKKMHDWMEAK